MLCQLVFIVKSWPDDPTFSAKFRPKTVCHQRLNILTGLAGSFCHLACRHVLGSPTFVADKYKIDQNVGNNKRDFPKFGGGVGRCWIVLAGLRTFVGPATKSRDYQHCAQRMIPWLKDTNFTKEFSSCMLTKRLYQ